MVPEPPFVLWALRVAVCCWAAVLAFFCAVVCWVAALAVFFPSLPFSARTTLYTTAARAAAKMKRPTLKMGRKMENKTKARPMV